MNLSKIKKTWKYAIAPWKIKNSTVKRAQFLGEKENGQMDYSFKGYPFQGNGGKRNEVLGCLKT